MIVLLTVCVQANPVSLLCPAPRVGALSDDARSVYSRPLGGISPHKNVRNPPKISKVNYAKIEFLRISSFWGLWGSPQTPTGALPLVPICLYCLNCTTFG